MAGRIQGITIEIDGNTTKLSQSLKGVDSQLKETQKSLKDIDKLLKLDPKNTELLTQKQKNLQRAIGDTEKRLSELRKAQEGVAEGSDEWDRLQREIIATEQDLKKLKSQYSDFGSVTAQKIAAAGKQMEEFGGKIQRVGDAFTPISTAATGAIAALGGLAYKTVTNADELATLSKQTGITTDEIQKMKYASDLVDVSFEDISGALTKLKPKITEDNEALKGLGVSVKNADGTTRNATDVFYDAISALSQIENETERDQKAMELFGRGADSLAGIIDDGGAALKEYGKQAEDLGLIMGGDTIENLNAVNDTIDTLKAQGGATLANLGGTIATVLAPSVEKLLGILGNVSDAISKLTPEQATLILRILAATAAIAPLLKVGGKLVSGVGNALKLAPKIATAAKLIGGALSLKTLGIAALIAGVAALVVVIIKNWDKIKAWTLDMVAKVKGAFESLKNGISNAVNAVKNTVSNVWGNIKTATSNAFEAVKNTVSDKMNNVKKSFEENGGGLKGIAAATMTGIKEYYTLGFDTLNSITGGKLTAIKDKVTTAFTNIKSAISTTWDNIKTTAASKIDNIKSSISTAFTNIVSKIKSIFTFNFTLPKLSLPTWDGIKGTLNTIISEVKKLFTFDFQLPTLKLPTWDGIKAALDEIVRKAKEAFKFDWSLPHIKLPHFRVQGGKWPYGLGGEGYLPSISIDWYRKAYENAMMFTKPTVMATPYGAKGFGDGAGAEIVLGLNKLRELVGGTGNVTVNVYGAPGQNVQELADAVTRRIINLQKQKAAAYA